MSTKGTHNIPAQEAPAQRVRSDWKTLVDKLSYKAIVNNIPYLAFLVLLAVLYISNSQRAVDMQREQDRENKVLKELRWKYMDVSSKLMYVKMESEVIKRASALGMKPMALPAYNITIDSSLYKQ
ncbi:hypothetical protein CAP35_14220 [Chitinophagaceae bacterium IBVUCB1]|jgi:hypothetical protein|nr:hypothetical protein CAP35_14220 [Chitinophagaceae bacterium IBVUCB1]